MNLRQDGRGLILMVEHLGNDDGLGWCPTVDLWKTRGHHGDKFAWRKGVSDSYFATLQRSLMVGVASCW